MRKHLKPSCIKEKVSIIKKDLINLSKKSNIYLLTTFLLVFIFSNSLLAQTYQDSFESGFDNWVNVTGDDMDWTMKTGSTGSSSTGPSSAYDGSYYVYTEASGYNNTTANLEGPTFSFSTGQIDFYYHMYGSSMGSLYLEIASSPYNTWTTIWSLSGDQGDSWQSASVNLNAYGGNDMRLRFRGVTGSSYQSDMAVDKINITYSTTPMSYSSCTTETPTTDDVYTGTIQNSVVRLNVVTTGITSPLDITSVTFNTNGTTSTSDITNAKVFYTTSTTFSNSTQFGSTVSSPSGSLVVSGTQTLSYGNNYFWLTYDIPNGATVDNVIDGECTSVTVDGSAKTPTVTAPNGSRTIKDAITSTTTETASTADVYQGVNNNEVIRLNVVNAAATGLIYTTSITFNTTGTNSASDISNAKVFYTTSTSFSASTQFGSTVSSPSGSYTVTGNQSLANGNNYFWLAYDIPSGATLNNVVDAECTSVTSGGAAKTPTVTAPTGSRTIKDAITSTTTETASTSDVYRGLNNNEVIRLNVVNTAGSGLLNTTSITFNTTGTNSTSDINNAKVYYTTSTTFSTSTQFGSTVSSPSGSYTVIGNQSLANGNNYFWLTYDIPSGATLDNVVDAECTSITSVGAAKTPTVTAPTGSRTIKDPITSTTTETASTSDVYRGLNNNEIIRLNVVNTAGSGLLNTTSITFNTTGTSSTSDISNAKVYYTTSTTFSTSTQFGSTESSPSSSYTVTGTQSLANGNNYFWLAYDISASATITNVVDGQCTSVISGGNTKTPYVTNPSGSRSIANNPVNVSATSGTTSDTYATLKDAFDKINDGTHQGVIAISLTGDTKESASAMLNETGYGSASYTSVSVMPNGGHRTISGNVSTQLIHLRSADNITFDGLNDGTNSLTLINTSTSENSSYGKVIDIYGYIINGVSDVPIENVTIQNCTIRGNTLTTPYLSFEGYYGAENITISNCDLGPYSSNHTSMVVSSGTDTYTNINFTGNNIHDFGKPDAYSNYGVLLRYIIGGSIANNKFYQSSSKTFTTSCEYFYCIDMNFCENLNVTGNVMGYANVSGTGVSVMSFAKSYAKFYGIHNNARTDDPVLISGNEIGGIQINYTNASSSFYFYGIYLETSNPYTQSDYYINENTFGSDSNPNSIVLNTSGGIGFYGVFTRSYSAMDHAEFNGNHFGGINTGTTSNPTGGGITCFLINSDYSSSGDIEINNNVIGYPLAPIIIGYSEYNPSNNTSVYGILTNSNDRYPYTISGNIVQNFTNYGNDDQYGYYTIGIADRNNETQPVTRTISSNIVRNITSKGGVRGIMANYAGTTTPIYINYNEVYNITGGAGEVSGIHYPGRLGMIGNNFIYQISADNDKPAYGIYLHYNPFSESDVLTNNIIVLGKDADGNNIEGTRLYAFYDGSASGSYYYNTAIVMGEATTGSNDTYCFYRTNTSNNYNTVIKNNLFINKRSNNGGSGKHYALRLGCNTSLSIDYNDCIASGTGGVLAQLYTPYTWQDKTTLGDIQTYTGQDANSINSNPQFLDLASNNFHLVGSSPCIGAGVNITGITTDYEGNTRPGGGTVADMGAYENSLGSSKTLITWTGSTDNDWNTASNWDLNVVPTDAHSVNLPDVSNDPTVVASAVCYDLTIYSGTPLTLNSNITVNGNLFLNNGLNLNGRVITLGPDATLTETTGNNVYGTSGTIQTTRNLSNVDENVAGLGLKITEASNLGSTTIIRGHAAQTGNSNTGIKRYYTVSSANSPSNATIVFNYIDSELNGCDEADLILFKSTNAGSTWIDMNGVVNTTDNYITLSGINSFSWWTAGDEGIPLPVSLLDFSAKCKPNNSVELNWSTASEINNSHFEIQQSFDAENFQTVGRIDGAGNSNTILNYKSIVENTENIQTYYKLKQVDFDGKFEYSKVIAVNCSENQLSSIDVYPNPFTNEISIDFNTLLKYNVKVEVRNKLGILIKVEVIEANSSNNKIELSRNLSAGIYFVVISNDKETIVRKLVKE